VKTYVIFVAVSGGGARTFIDIKTNNSTTMNNPLHIDHALLPSAAHNRSQPPCFTLGGLDLRKGFLTFFT
jgi:hypothetical protein